MLALWQSIQGAHSRTKLIGSEASGLQTQGPVELATQRPLRKSDTGSWKGPEGARVPTKGPVTRLIAEIIKNTGGKRAKPAVTTSSISHLESSRN